MRQRSPYQSTFETLPWPSWPVELVTLKWGEHNFGVWPRAGDPNMAHASPPFPRDHAQYVLVPARVGVTTCQTHWPRVIVPKLQLRFRHLASSRQRVLAATTNFSYPSPIERTPIPHTEQSSQQFYHFHPCRPTSPLSITPAPSLDFLLMQSMMLQVGALSRLAAGGQLVPNSNLLLMLYSYPFHNHLQTMTLFPIILNPSHLMPASYSKFPIINK